MTRAFGWSGRALGVLAATFWWFAVVGSAIEEGVTPIEPVGLAVVGLVILASSGVVLMFLRPRLGGLLTLAAGLAFIVFAVGTAGQNVLFAAASAGGPFVVAGTLVWWAHRRLGRWT